MFSFNQCLFAFAFCIVSAAATLCVGRMNRGVAFYGLCFITLASLAFTSAACIYVLLA